MNHIDEGTIHAWLDGALDAEQARAVEAHVAECRHCADAVAEARGLVAASTRILGALDDVPANVIPARTAPTKQKRVWRAAPWVTGIAAVLVAAVVLRIAPEAGRESSLASLPVMDSGSPAREALVVEQPQANAPASPPPRPVTSAPARVPAPAPSVAAAPVAEQDFSGRGARGAEVARVGEARDEARRASGMDAARRTAQRSMATDLATTAAPATGDVAPAPPPSVVPVLRGEAAAGIAKGIVGELALQRSAPGYTGLAGCYALTRPGASVTSTMAVAARQRARVEAAPSAAALSEERAPARMIVRLDTLIGRPGYMVRAAIGDSSLGWWNRIAPDSARLDLLSAGLFTVTAKERVDCP